MDLINLVGGYHIFFPTLFFKSYHAMQATPFYTFYVYRQNNNVVVIFTPGAFDDVLVTVVVVVAAAVFCCCCCC